MSNTNGFFGSIQGPFTANEEIITSIQSQCRYTIDYISKLGIHYAGNFDLDLDGNMEPQYFVNINGIEFQIGKTRLLELEDVEITSIQFVQNVGDSWYIDYQYQKIE